MKHVRTWRTCLIPVVAVLLYAMPLAAQVGTGRVAGIVRDGATGEPLAGVQVYLEGTGVGQLTAANGRYFLMNVPAGTYTMVAEFLGYAVTRRENVVVAIDVTRTIDIDMTTEAVALEEVVVEAERVPLVEVSTTGSRDIITAQDVEALPVRSVAEMLALQHGFFEVPMTPELTSFLDQERGVTPVHIRGGRMGENVTMVDGIPVTNFILGDAPFNPSTISVEQADYSRGGFEAKYGNALSGVVNIRTREPREYFQGSLSYQSTAFGGWLGSKYDELRAAHQLEGFISGPVPGTDNKLMFVVTASNTEGSGGVYEFDDHIFVPHAPQGAYLADTARVLFASEYDLIPGWRSMGFNRARDVMAKLQYRYSPVAKLTFQVTENETKNQGFAWNAQRVGWDLFGQCQELYPTMADVCRRYYLGGKHPETLQDLWPERQRNQWTFRNSVERSSRLYALNWDHTLPASRVAYNLAWGRNETFRDTCTFAGGYCFGDRVGWVTTSGPFLMHGGSHGHRHAVYGTGITSGGDRSISEYVRGDLEWQATDHHNISTGFFFQRHDIYFTESRQVGNYAPEVHTTQYSGEPWDGALYLQDRIEYDFITLRLGLRFDYGRASGLFFSNPQNPTNGTTAYHVCTDPTSFGVAADRFVFYDEANDRTVTGITACSLSDELMEFAVLKAMEDDFEAAKPRRALSPRLGVSFPLTETSSIFFNYGRFTQNPRYHNLYRMTGIGTAVEGTRDLFEELVGGTTRVPLVGNAHLLSEQTSNYELGYVASLGDGLYGVNATLFTKDQYNLTGTRSGGIDELGRIIFDPGSTYRSTTLNYVVLMNLDFQTARGIELTLRRRLENYWGFDVRYSYSQVRTNAAPPELEYQRRLEEGDREIRREIRSYIDRPHTGSLILRLQVGQRTPDIPFGEYLRNASLSFTGRYSTGVPYTPQTTFSGGTGLQNRSRLERNSATAPSQYQINMLARKNFRHGNVNWGAFLRVDNVLNTRYCVRVYESTGRCDGGQLAASRLYAGGDSFIYQSATISETSYTSQAWDRPDYYSPPRSISAGMSVTF